MELVLMILQAISRPSHSGLLLFTDRYDEPQAAAFTRVFSGMVVTLPTLIANRPDVQHYRGLVGKLF